MNFRLAHLEDAFRVRTVSLHTTYERQRMVNPRRTNPINPGLIPLYERTGRANLGHALETVVLLELERRGCKTGCIRTRDGYEVDFIARDPEGNATLILPRPERGAQWGRGQRIQSSRMIHPIPASVPAHPDLYRSGRLDRQRDPRLSRAPRRLDPASADFLEPATISFGQSLVPEDLDRAGEAAARSDLVIALGSSLSVYPAASIPLVAARHGVPYVIINRGPTGHDDLPEVTLRFEGDVTELFPPLVAAALADA